jgi:hypothetical protein
MGHPANLAHGWLYYANGFSPTTRRGDGAGDEQESNRLG